jgi:hypothetical protein
MQPRFLNAMVRLPRGMCRRHSLVGTALMSSFCLILEPIPLVARDLALTARENLGYEPLIAKSEADALRQLESLGAAERLPLAFVHKAPPELAAGALLPQLEARDAKIILLNVEPDRTAPSGLWPTLAWPFSTGQVIDLVQSLHTLTQKPAAG